MDVDATGILPLTSSVPSSFQASESVASPSMNGFLSPSAVSVSLSLLTTSMPDGRFDAPTPITIEPTSLQRANQPDWACVVRQHFVSEVCALDEPRVGAA